MIFKEKEVLLTNLINFLSKILGNSFKIQPPSSKIAQNKLLWSTLIKFAGKKHPKTTNSTFVNFKGSIVVSISIGSALELTFGRFLLTYLDDYQKRSTNFLISLLTKYLFP